MPVPYTFGTATAAIPLSQLDSNFSTAITIGNTAVQLGNTVTTLNNMTLANVTISSGNVTLTNVSVTTANVSGTANVSSLVVLTNETVLGNTTVTGNVTATTSVTTPFVTSAAATNLLLKSAGTTSITIDTSQNVGVGVTPSAWDSVFKPIQLGSGGAFIAGRTGTISQIQLGANAYFNGTNWIYLNTNNASRYYQSGGIHYWETAASGTAGNTISFTQAMTLDASGNYLVGTTNIFNLSKFTFDAGSSRGMGIKNNNTSAQVLQVNNDNASYADLGGGMVYIVQNGATETGFRAISVYTNSGARFAVRGDGTIYSTNTSVQSISDVRFKENIKALDIGLAEVMQLQPRRFDWKQGKGTGEKNVAGFIAQEIETVLPELVSEFQDGIEDTTMYKSVGYGGLVPTLVKAIQEQQAIITSLTDRITALEAK